METIDNLIILTKIHSPRVLPINTYKCFIYVAKYRIRFNDILLEKLNLKKRSEILFAKNDEDKWFIGKGYKISIDERLPSDKHQMQIKTLIPRGLKLGLWELTDNVFYDESNKIDWYELKHI